MKQFSFPAGHAGTPKWGIIIRWGWHHKKRWFKCYLYRDYLNWFFGVICIWKFAVSFRINHPDWFYRTGSCEGENRLKDEKRAFLRKEEAWKRRGKINESISSPERGC